MRHAAATVLVVCGLLAQDASTVATQGPPLTVTSASPSGEVTQLADASEIRIVFSEPMVALGDAETQPPSWLTVTPAIRANYYWSGTRTLIATVDPDSPLPHATRYSVRIAGDARSVSGRLMASPHAFSFTTPTVRLLSADWYRKSGRFDSPVVIGLRFNQPVRAADVIAHTSIRHAPHAWSPPQIDAAARARLEREDPAGLARFDGKVRGADRTARSDEAVPVALATSWDERRFPRDQGWTVLETTSIPPTNAWLSVNVHESMPSLEGAERHPAQSSVLRLEPTFFVGTLRCASACDPDAQPGIPFLRGVHADEVARALRVHEAVAGGADRPVVPADRRSAPTYRPADGFTSVPLVWMGLVQPPARTWVVRIDPALTAADGQRLDYPWMGIIETTHGRPFASWTGAVWEAANGPRVPFLARNAVDGRVFLAPMTAADAMARLLGFGRRPPALVPGVAGTTQRLDGVPDAFEAHGIDLSRVLSPKGTGLVWAAVSEMTAMSGSARDTSFGNPRAALLQVTNLGVTVKDSPHATWVLVTRLDDATPVADAAVSIINRDSREAWRGRSGPDGVAIAPSLALRSSSNSWEQAYVVTAEKDGDTSWVASDWTGDVQPWSFGLRAGLNRPGDQLVGSVFTDRGVYRQGDELRIKSVLRFETPQGVRLLNEGTRVFVETADAQGRTADRRTLVVNRWSSVDWSWQVPEDAPLGRYSIRLSAEDPPRPVNRPWPRAAEGGFLVAAFRRPDFRVDATLAADPPVAGTTLRGQAEARFLFGAPLADRPVRWFVAREPVLSIPSALRERYPASQFAIGYFPRSEIARQASSQVTTRTEPLGPTGELRVSVPTEAGVDFASRYRFEADVESVSGQHIANRAETIVHPASLYVGLARPSFFVEVAKGLTTGVVAAGLDGQPRAGVRVTVSLLREQWTSERRPENPGSVEWARTEVPAGEWTVTTTTGVVSLPIPLVDGGSFILRATARDERERPTRTDVGFYALGRGVSRWRSDGNRIELTPERRTWRPGETARILVQSPWERATAFVTAEREGVRHHRQVAITSTQDAVEIPITEADVPNVFVSVLLLKGRTQNDPGPDDDDPGRPAFRLGYAELVVDDASKRLRVSVSADRQQYRPRDEVTVSVRVSDPSGKPRAGEVTLWAMDHGLLSLTGYTTPDVVRAIYAPRGLQVLTQDTRARLIGRRTIVTPGQGQGGAGGGGRGGGTFAAGLAGGVVGGIPAPLAQMLTVDALAESVEAGANAEPEVRTDFRPLVFWVGSVATDASGAATTRVTLPDSLTTYRIMAVAGDSASQFGAADTEIRATKSLAMLPSFPRFLANGDKATFGAVITNGMTVGGDAVVTVRSLDEGQVAFSGPLTQTLRLAPGESAPVRFEALARAMGRARVRMTVALGGETDAFELALPVITPWPLQTVAAYGDTISRASERIAIPAGVVGSHGALTVSLASTALVGLTESARYLDEYPYECAEQMASRALALLLSADIGGTFALPGVKADEQRAAGLRALNDLTRYQCPSGGFALWPGQCAAPSPYLSAYILNVARVARSLNAEADRIDVARALDFLQRELRQPPPEIQWWPAWSASQAYAVKALAEFGRNPSAEIGRLYGSAERLPVFALSYLADALTATGDRGPRYQSVVQRLTNAIRVDADRAHVQEVDDASLVWLWNTNVRATAVVLSGLARRQDEPTFVAPLARWLLAARENGRWGTTQENAVALDALVSYYRAFEAEEPRMTATVALGGTSIGTATFNGRSTAVEQVRLAMPDLLRRIAAGSARDLTVSRAGTGRVYYTARLQYLAPESPDPVDRGMRIERQYEPLDAAGAVTSRMSFSTGDLVRVRLTISLPHEGRFIAITDPVPAGFEPIDALLSTTASDLARQSFQQPGQTGWMTWRRYGGFDHVAKHDDRVVAFATRLGAGRHVFTYLARATTAGIFGAAGARGEAMYAPEINGRSAAALITVK